MKRLILVVSICALLLLAGVQAAWAAPPASGQTVHIVRPGENLYRIALRYGTSVQAIAAANGIYNPNCIYAGQRLIIPGWSGGGGGDHGHGGGGDHGHGGGGYWYTVSWGDTLASIARRHGLDMWSIAAANNLANPNCIYAGQKLYIP